MKGHLFIIVSACMLWSASIDTVCSDLHVKPCDVHKSSITLIPVLQIFFKLVKEVSQYHLEG